MQILLRSSQATGRLTAVYGLSVFFLALSAHAAVPNSSLSTLVASLRSQPETVRSLDSGRGAYDLRIHAPRIASLVKATYSSADLATLEDALGGTLALHPDARGLVKAADRFEGESTDDPTHYDAVWVRDSLWAYLALDASVNVDERASAHRLLLTLLDYFSNPAQRARMTSVTAHPAAVHARDGAMRVLHIRFDGKSSDFSDVTVDGKPQPWDHKQNDALGLFLDLVCRAALKGNISAAEMTAERSRTIAGLPGYFEAIQFASMEDAGSWEEIERVNTSSVALVTSGLERMRELLRARALGPRAIAKKIVQASGRKPVSVAQLSRLTSAGYARVLKALSLGGESPGSPPDAANPRFRNADAALLNLIYPARLNGLRRPQYDRVLEIVQPLIGDVGVRRYLGDSYQSGNFWFAAESGTDDTSSAQGFAQRGKRFIPGSEAQWFFDSWLSIAYGALSVRYRDPKYRALQTEHFNRSLAQITGGTREAPVPGADGKPVPSMALPESYNTVQGANQSDHFFVPSPITPLNWAKASLRLALKEMRSTN